MRRSRVQVPPQAPAPAPLDRDATRVAHPTSTDGAEAPGRSVVAMNRTRLALGALALLVASGAALGAWVVSSSGASPATLSKSSLLSQCGSNGYLASTPPVAVQVRGDVGIVIRRSGREYAFCAASSSATSGGGWLPREAPPVSVLETLYAGPSGVPHALAGMWALLHVGPETRRIRVATQLAPANVSYLSDGLVLIWIAPTPTLYDVFNAYEGPKPTSYSGRIYGVGEVVAFSKSGSVTGSVEIEACPESVVSQSMCFPQRWTAH